MKTKVLALILAMFAVLSLAACGGDSNSKKKDSSSGDSGKTAQSDNSGETEKKESKKSSKMVGSGDLEEFHVEIKGASIVEDYEGKPAIVITYAWTNNSEETTSAMVALYGKAFQDGVQMDTAIVIADGFAIGESMTDIRPGTTIDVSSAYSLTSETSTVEFELSKLVSLSKDMVTMDFDPANLG